MKDCLFCKIIRGEIKARLELDTPEVTAFYDINPQAPFHVLVVPRKHIERVGSLEAGDAKLAGELLCQARNIAEKNGFSDYRLVFNNGEKAGQSVFHVHLHLLAGRPFTWPPG